MDLSRKECPFVIKPKIQRPSTAVESEDMDTDMESKSLFLRRGFSLALPSHKEFPAVVLVCQLYVFSQCQKLPWKAALDRPHLPVPDQRWTTEHRTVLLIRLVQVHTARARAHTHTNTCHYCTLIITMTRCLPRCAVYPPEGSSVKVYAKFLEESHPGSCLFWWYPTWWVIVILILLL